MHEHYACDPSEHIRRNFCTEQKYACPKNHALTCVLATSLYLPSGKRLAARVDAILGYEVRDFT